MLMRALRKMKRWGRVAFDYTNTTKDGAVCYHNWWPCNYEEEWFHRFVVQNIGTERCYHFFSVFGPRIALTLPTPNKVFFCGENVHNAEWPYKSYQDHALGDVKLALGYDDIQDERYIRFPLWLLYMFDPVVDRYAIRERIEEINHAENTRKYECVLISRHDKWNMRGPIYDALKDHLAISCAGKWKQNTDELWTVYNDDKPRYLKEFKFNICPENFDTPYYVTEKLFEAFRSGTIPIYAGGGDHPEPEIVNRSALLLWERGQSDHSALVQEVIRLARDEIYYDKFVHQVRLLPYTEEFVYEQFSSLKERLLQIRRG